MRGFHFEGDIAPSISQVAEDGEQGRCCSVEAQGLGDDRLARRLADPSSGVADQPGAGDPRQQRHGRLDPGQRPMPRSGRVNRWSRRSGSVIRHRPRHRPPEAAAGASDHPLRKGRAAVRMPFALEGAEDDAGSRTHSREVARRAGAGLSVRLSAWAFLRMCVCRDAGQIATALDRMLDMERIDAPPEVGRQRNRMGWACAINNQENGA